MPGYQQTEADARLISVYGDYPHANDGCHLHGGVQDDLLSQRLWKRVVQLSPTHYDVPKGKVGRRFVATVACLLRDVRLRKHNSERVIIFVAVVLQTRHGVRAAKDIRRLIETRMNLWDEGKEAAMVEDIETECLSKIGSPRERDAETEARAFNTRVMSGRIRSAVRTLTAREGGGVMQPDDKDTKSGHPVLDVLRQKHPVIRSPVLDKPDPACFEHYPSIPSLLPQIITAEVVESVIPRLAG